MASPPYLQNYGASVSPPYPSNSQLPTYSRKRQSEMPSAPPLKKRKSSMMVTTSSLSVHPLRQTSFPPDGNNEMLSQGGRSPSIDTMSRVSGSVVGPEVKKKRGRKPKQVEETASLVGGLAPTAISGTSGRRGQSRGFSVEEEDDIGGETDVAIVSRTKEEREKEKQHRAMLVAAFDEDQFKRYEVWRSARLPDSTVRRLVNQTLSQSVPASVIFAVKSVTKMFAGEIIELARKVQAEWYDLNPETESGMPSPSPRDVEQRVMQKNHLVLRPDHLREALRRYKLERNTGNVGLLGLARHNHAPGVERFSLKAVGKRLLL